MGGRNLWSWGRPHVIMAVAAVVGGLAACGRGPARAGPHETSPVARDAGAAAARDARPRGRDGDAGAAREAGPPAALRGRVQPVEGEPVGPVLVVVPGTTKVRATATVAADGSFSIAGLEPGTYRVILPADGLHSTADLYAKVSPDAGPTELTIPRSRGCPVKIAVRADDGHLLAGAQLELTLPDLPQVRQPQVVRARTDEGGRATIVGSCVRGFFEGRLTVPSRGSFAVRHGYVGTGRDQFDIVLPAPDAGPDAGVTYTNDD